MRRILVDRAPGARVRAVIALVVLTAVALATEAGRRWTP
jgi:hypothetical protein